MFYLACGYFISYLPYAILAKALTRPGNAQLVAVALVVSAVVALWYRTLRGSLQGIVSSSERVVLFVCGGNQSRSAMAECIARAAMAPPRSGHLVTIASAGVKLHAPGAPMTDTAYAVLQEAGVIPHRPRSRPLTAELCRQADVIYCTTAEHRAAVLALAPDAAVLIQQTVENRRAEQFL